MSEDINYSNNPLHGLSLKNLLTELVDHYGFEILYAYLNINCFKTNPSIDSSVKFLKKTDWAREKVEGFYLYKYKNLPKAVYDQYQLPPRDRIIPDGQLPGEPAELSFEDAERLREERERKAAEHGKGRGQGFGKARGEYQARSSRYRDDSRSDNRADKQSPRGSERKSKPSTGKADPWGKWKGK